MSKRADKTPPTKGVNQVNVAATRPGLIVVDTALNLVASNTEAIQILTFPEPLEKIRHLDSWLTNKIRAHLVERQMQRPTAFVGEFRSAKRTYLCRSFPLDMNANGNGDQSGAEHQGEDRHADDRHSEDNGSGVPTALLVLMMERRSNGAVKLAEVAERFGLTAREQETVQLLLQGLTSKEIAQRMQISPNTVKAFIRLVMVKMNVSTRSGIIGKIVGPKG
jgi:DNA-binding CsgD family transcriptional regulator